MMARGGMGTDPRSGIQRMVNGGSIRDLDRPGRRPAHRDETAMNGAQPESAGADFETDEWATCRE